MSGKEARAGSCGECNHLGQITGNESADRAKLAGRVIFSRLANPNSGEIPYKSKLFYYDRLHSLFMWVVIQSTLLNTLHVEGGVKRC